MRPYTLLQEPDLSLPFAGGRRTGHLRTEGENFYWLEKGIMPKVV